LILLDANRSYPKRKSQIVPSQRNRDCQNDLAIIIHLKMKKGRATKRKTFIDCRSNILFFSDTDKKLKVWLQQKIGRG
jgi:hypothetical protein